MGEIKPRPNGSVARRGNGEDIVMYFRVGIKGQPLGEVRQPPGEVNGTEAGAGIVAGEFLPSVGVADAVEAVPESTQGYGRVSHAAPDDGALKAKFEVRRWLERNLFRVCPGADRDVMTLERPHEKVIANEACDARDVGNI